MSTHSNHIYYHNLINKFIDAVAENGCLDDFKPSEFMSCIESFFLNGWDTRNNDLRKILESEPMFAKLNRMVLRRKRGVL